MPKLVKALEILAEYDASFTIGQLLELTARVACKDQTQALLIAVNGIICKNINITGFHYGEPPRFEDSYIEEAEWPDGRQVSEEALDYIADHCASFEQEYAEKTYY